MSSTATAAAASLHQNGGLAVRLSSSQTHSHAHAAPPHGAPSRKPVDPSASTTAAAARRVPRKPAIPRHPIPSMQEAFAESLAEVTSDTLSLKPKLAVDDAQVRRDRLIDQDKSEGPPAALWRFRPGQNCHELRKLLAQIAFGVYLLLKGMANSNAQVVAILQGHIDEVDEYLRTTMDDLTLAIRDLTARLDHLRLPLSNLTAFEEMLEDRNFRLRIVEGNVRIEHILSRTTTALLQTMQDVKEGMGCTRDFNAYLSSESQGSWHSDSDVAGIYEAMCGNADGWLNAFADLEEKSNTLDVLVSKLADMVTEMDRCAGDVSRRTRFSIQPFTLPEHEKHVAHISRLSKDSLDPSIASSHETTPPSSPGIQVPQSPPRLSLRLSALDGSLSTNFLDLGSRLSFFGGNSLFPSLDTPPSTDGTNEVPTPKVAQQHATEQLGPAADIGTEEPEIRSSSWSDSGDSSESGDSGIVGACDHDVDGGDDLLPIPLRIDANTPKPTVSDPIIIKTEPAVDSEDEQDERDEAPLYLLQPRTYTPQPAPPLPSPMVHQHEPNPFLSSTPPQRHAEAKSPRLAIPVPTLESVPRQLPTPTPSYEPLSPGIQAQATAVHMRTVSGRFRVSDSLPPERPERKSSMLPPSHSGSSTKSTETIMAQLLPRKRASLRERVSLRTTPPEAIHVPSPNAPLQRPVFASPRTYQNYRTFTGPDSANSLANSTKTADQPTGHSHVEPPPSSGSAGTSFSPPVLPAIIPSPHSDQQYFRPVQASPHSPLQQRPHTAGQVPARTHHLRNAPSSMGMSMLSSVTTLTHDSETGRTIKKKRSAFGWLKKAFTLDEDERVEFDQRKKQSQQSAYYEPKPQKFLDGKRIR